MTQTTSAPAARKAGAVAPRLSGTVRIVGAGLLGASVGHALRAKGIDVVLTDASPRSCASPSTTVPGGFRRTTTRRCSSSWPCRRM